MSTMAQPVLHVRRDSPSYIVSYKFNAPSFGSTIEKAPFITSTSALPLKSPNAEDDSDDDDDDFKLEMPQLSALGQMAISEPNDGANGGVRAAITARSSPSSVGVGSRSGSGTRSGIGRSYMTAATSDHETSNGQIEVGATRVGSPGYMTAREMVTPAPGRGSIRPYAGYSATKASSGSSGPSSTEGKADVRNTHETPAGTSANYVSGSVYRPVGTVTRNWQTTTKRTATRVLGMPIRGPRRLDTTDPGSPEERDRENGADDAPIGSASSRRSRSSQEERNVDAMDIDSGLRSSRPSLHSPKSPTPATNSSRKRSSPSDSSPAIEAYTVASKPSHEPAPWSPKRHKVSPKNESPFDPMSVDNRHQYRSIASSLERKPVPKFALPAKPLVQNENKENVLPAVTFKRPAPLPSSFASKTASPSPPSPVRKPAMAIATPEVKQESRAALGNIPVNTPRRVAPPPPPKMEIPQSTAAQAASASTATKKKRQHVMVNGRQYLRLDQIGRGGSAKVYKVMADNFKMLAMKKVMLDQQDEAAIRGFKGEIDLLKRLQDEDRVVKLFDYEVNDEKGTLTVLLECGELDLNRIITSRHSADDAVLDLSFVRHYWREMLECVAAVHSKNIVHSDLKPANFVLVCGRLKLIDFGIANAIADDTVNVHREQQVGTISYMSPEAIVDFNASQRPSNGILKLPSLHKLGAPSDVWSLGCILYQMTYGRTPFAHLSNMYLKLQAIPNASHEITYPPVGIGGAPVSRSLIATMKGCLERDIAKRATIKEMLNAEDRFLNPEREREGVVDVGEETLASLLENACEYTREKGMPTEEQVRLWAKDVYGKLKRKMFERRR